MSASRYFLLRLREVVQETRDAKSFVFELPHDMALEQQRLFAYRPGQFLTLRLHLGDRHVPRCYSMASAPDLDQGLRITVKRVAGGRGSNWMCEHARAGALFEVLAPAGVFTPSHLGDDFLLMAGGSGVTPIFSILRSALAASASSRIFLLYANRDPESVIFAAQLLELQRAHPQRLQLLHWLESQQGLASPQQLAEIARPWTAAQAFLCGPAGFMAACEQALLSLGMDGSQIHVERFASLADEEAVVTPIALPAAGAIDRATVEVHHQGQWLRFECAGNEVVLDAALRAGIDLPYVCREGLCASCICQVQSGSVFLRANDALDVRDVNKGWTLACQAIPTSERLTLKFA